MTTARLAHGSASGPDGRVYVIGGITGPAGGPTVGFGTSRSRRGLLADHEHLGPRRAH